jgi:glycosyltransferase involved in cell wall biosynthesis
MRVLFVAKHLHFPQGGGGLERNTHELCLRLIRRGVVPAVMCNIQPDGSFFAFRNRLARKLKPRTRFPVDCSLGYEVYRGWANEDGAAEVAARFRPDIVIAQSAKPVPLIESFCGLGIPRLAYFHEVERAWDAGVLAAMDGVGLLANSTFTARRMAEHVGYAPRVIYPLVDRSLYTTPTRPTRALLINTKPRKGVEIAFQLAESRPDVPFDFVRYWSSSADEVQALRRRARAAGNITVHAPTNDLRPLYGRARLLLAPSQWDETWGRVATEVQVNGTPVLASDRGGLPEAVGRGGLIVRHDAPIGDWRAAFARLWDDPAEHRQRAAAAREHSHRQEIQPDAIVAAFLDALSELLGTRGSVA